MPPSGEYKEERAMWVKFGTFEAVIYLDNSGPMDGGEVILTFYNRRKNWSVNLSELTIADMDALQQVLDRAFETARPVAEARDRKAQDDFDRGIDTNPRSYRQLPQLVVRQRVFDEHGPRLPGRPTDVPLLDWHPGKSSTSAGSTDELLRPDGGGVAESGEEEGRSENSAPPDHEPSGLCDLGEHRDADSGGVQRSDAKEV